MPPPHLHLEAAPLSNEQVATSRTPPCKKQFRKSSRASACSKHCNMGPAGIMIELRNSITAITLVQQFTTDGRFKILIKGIKLVDGHTYIYYIQLFSS